MRHRFLYVAATGSLKISIKKIYSSNTRSSVYSLADSINSRMTKSCPPFVLKESKQFFVPKNPVDADLPAREIMKDLSDPSNYVVVNKDVKNCKLDINGEIECKEGALVTTFSPACAETSD